MRKIVKSTKKGADRYLTALPSMRGERQIAPKAIGLRTQFRRRIGPRPRPAMQSTRRRIPLNGHSAGVKLNYRLSPNSATNRPVGEEQTVPPTRRFYGGPATRLRADQQYKQILQIPRIKKSECRKSQSCSMCAGWVQ